MDNNITSVEQAYAKLGRQIPDFSLLPGLHKSTIAHELLGTVIEAVNDGWIADHDDTDQIKYEPLFRKTKDGFALGCVCYRYGRSGVGARLCFVSRPAAEHTAKHFPELYNDLLSK